MIKYTVKKGDTLSGIAYRYQTTIAILLGDNPTITDKNLIKTGQIIQIRTAEEYAKDVASSAKDTLNTGYKVKVDAKPQTTGMTVTTSTINWGGMSVNVNQIGIATFIKNAHLYTFDNKGNLVSKNTVKKNDRYRAYGTSQEKGGLVVLGGSYAKKSDVSFEYVPAEYKLDNNTPGTSTNAGDANLNIPTPSKPNKGSELSPSDARIPQFEMPGYRRTRMRVKKKDGNLLTIELRLTAFNSSYGNQYTPNRTNAGWMINVGGKNLTQLNMSGFLLDSKSNPEVQNFLNIYNAQLTPRNSDKYFSSAIVTLVHKNREYKGLVSALNLSDDSTTPLDQKFSMQFIVLSEKSLTFSQSNSDYDFTISRKGIGEVSFLSSLSAMLRNPITGK